MKRRYTWVIVVCLLLLVGGAVWALLSAGEPEIVIKARTLHAGMSADEVKAILGEPQVRDRDVGKLWTGVEQGEWMYWGGHDVRRLFTWRFPFVTAEGYNLSHKWILRVEFSNANYQLISVRVSCWPSYTIREIPLLPAKRD